MHSYYKILIFVCYITGIYNFGVLIFGVLLESHINIFISDNINNNKIEPDNMFMRGWPRSERLLV